MNYFKSVGSLVVGTAATLIAASSASAAIQLAYDAAASNVGAGIYAFQLSGVPSSPFPSYNSTLEVQDFSVIGNTQNPLQTPSAPSGWNYSIMTVNTAEWYFENTSGTVNGVFDVKGTPNLQGSLMWDFEDSGHGENVSGYVSITPVPEPEAYSMIGGSFALLGSVFPLCRRFVKR